MINTPSVKTILDALTTLTYLAHHVQPTFKMPHITCNDDEISLEWWNNDKKLDIYFDDDGMDIIDTRRQPPLDNQNAELLTAWKWLMNDA